MLNQYPERFERCRNFVKNFQKFRIFQKFGGLGENPDLCFKKFQILQGIENIFKTLQDLNVFEKQAGKETINNLKREWIRR